MKHTAIILSDDDWDEVIQVLGYVAKDEADEGLAYIHDSIATQREAAAKAWNEKFGHNLTSFTAAEKEQFTQQRKD